MEKRTINPEVYEAGRNDGMVWSLVQVLRRVMERIERTEHCPICEGNGGRHYNGCPIISLTTLQSGGEED